MSHAGWDRSLETGNEEIDSQHQQLFELAQELESSIRGGAGSEDLKGPLARFLDLTIEHFQTEERVMQEMRYPGYGAHVAKHCDLVAKGHELNGMAAYGRRITEESARFLGAWLRHHIKEEDQAFAAYCRDRASVA